MALRILALEPYYGGSHQAFLDGWAAHSCHDFTLVTLPAFHWKWRMRHAAITMAAAECGGGNLSVLILSNGMAAADLSGRSTRTITPSSYLSSAQP